MAASRFPDRHWKVVRRVWRFSLITVAVTGLPAMALTYMAMSMDVLAFPAAIADALERASDQDIRFSLLLRHGNSTSALEWERRIGTAF